MAETTEISWADATFNPWIGCTKVSPACQHCYAERDFDHRKGRVKWGINGTRSMTSESNWRNPAKWNRKATAEGRRLRVFCASLADVFEEWHGPVKDADGRDLWIDGETGVISWNEGDEPLSLTAIRRMLFKVIDETPSLDWLLLTKRPENVSAFLKEIGRDRMPPNVWLGTSVENDDYRWRIEEILKVESSVRWISVEPQVGPLELLNRDGRGWDYLHGWRAYVGAEGANTSRVDWVVAGGESGPAARPSHPAWFRDLRDQCVRAGVPFHFKQWGEWAPDDHSPGMAAVTFVDSQTDDLPAGMICVGKKAAGRLLDGREWIEFPSPLIEANR